VIQAMGVIDDSNWHPASASSIIKLADLRAAVAKRCLGYGSEEPVLSIRLPRSCLAASGCPQGHCMTSRAALQYPPRRSRSKSEGSSVAAPLSSTIASSSSSACFMLNSGPASIAADGLSTQNPGSAHTRF